MATYWKIHGLAATSGEATAFTILAFDHRQSFAGKLTPRQEETISYNIAFSLELTSYGIDPKLDKSSVGFADRLPKLIRDIASRLGALEPDALNLEFPDDDFKHSDEGNLDREHCEF